MQDQAKETRDPVSPHGIFAVQTLSSRSEGIDMLRAVLALWVLFTHLIPMAATMNKGASLLTIARNVLVDIFQGNGTAHPAVVGFIVLSGYCIHRNGLRAANHDIRGYAVRRFFRIAPVYLLACLIGAILYVFDRRQGGDLAYQLTSTPLLTVRGVIAQVSCLSAWIPSMHIESFSGNSPLVTVAAEVWLYTIYPIAFLSAKKRISLLALVFTAIVTWLIIFLHVRSTGAGVLNSWWQGNSAISFLPIWWIGAFAVDDRVATTFIKYLWGILAVWIVLTVVLINGWTDALAIVELRKGILALLFALLVRALDRNPKLMIGWLAELGRSAYSVYALHRPLLAFCLIYGTGLWTAGAVAVIGGCVISFLYERPFIRFGRRFS